MNLENKKDLIIRLIKDDIINTKLVNGLDKLGLFSDDYILNLGDTVFRLFGFPEEDEESFEFYMDQRKRANKFSIKSHKPFGVLAEDIYNELEKRLPQDKKKKAAR
jgi:hypothetical protein